MDKSSVCVGVGVGGIKCSKEIFHLLLHGIWVIHSLSCGIRRRASTRHQLKIYNFQKLCVCRQKITKKIGSSHSMLVFRTFGCVALQLVVVYISILITDMVRDSVRSVSSPFVLCHTSLQKNVTGVVEPWFLVTKGETMMTKGYGPW